MSSEVRLGSVEANLRKLKATQVPVGGTAGQFLKKNSPSDYDFVWGTIQINGIPAGGTAGQALTKVNSTDYNATWTTLGGGSGTVTSVSVVTANGVSGSVATATTTPAITLTLGAITPTSVASSGTVTGTNLSGTNTGDQTITLTGGVTGSGAGSFAATVITNANLTSDVTSVGNATTLANIPTTVTMAGKVTATNIVAPATPAAGKNAFYFDSTSKNIASINDAGTINHGAQTKAVVASNFLTGLNDAGAFSASQPAFTDISGTLTVGQFGANVITYAKIQQGTALSVPGVAGNATANLADIVGTAGQVFRVNAGGTVLGFGTVDLSQTSSITGVLQAASFPAMTGDVANTVGTVATTIQPNVVGNTKLAQMPTLTVKGNNTGGTANALDLTVAQVRTMLGVTGLSTSVILDFGTGKDTISQVVALTGVTTASLIIGSVSWDSTLGRASEELAIDPIDLSFEPGAGQITINAAASVKTVNGKYKITMMVAA